MIGTGIRRGNQRVAGMWVRRSVAVVALLACAAGAAADTLEGKVKGALAQARLGNAKVGVSVLDCQTDKELVDIAPSGASADRGLIPASNLKLLTSGAALLTLGKAHEFRTELVVDGTRLIVKGAGDPAFADPELLDKMQMSVDQFVDKLVESIRASSPQGGLTEVIVDDRVFDREFVHPDWPAGQLHLSYCAQVSGMNFHGNVLNVFVSPGQTVGAEAAARPEPSGNWITIRRLAKTAKGGNTEVWLEREPSPPNPPYSFRLHGTVRNTLDRPVQVTVQDPGLFFARVLADRLKKAGLTGAAGITARTAAPEEQFTGGTVAAVVRTPISVAMERCNIDSDNLYAESLCKAAGHKATGQPGSWINGSALIRMQVRDRLGAEYASSLNLADGCGLSRNDRVSAETLTRWLRVMANDADCGDLYVRSLAIAGEEGTLRKRFKGSKIRNEVRAKSGYIREVRTLSGYVTNLPTGRRIAFSILINDVPSGADARAKEAHEKIVEIVDDYLAAICKPQTAGATGNTAE